MEAETTGLIKPRLRISAPIVNQDNTLSTTLGVEWFNVTCFSDHTANYVSGNSVPGNG